MSVSVWVLGRVPACVCDRTLRDAHLSIGVCPALPALILACGVQIRLLRIARVLRVLKLGRYSEGGAMIMRTLRWVLLPGRGRVGRRGERQRPRGW